jgi:hypothetical protein
VRNQADRIAHPIGPNRLVHHKPAERARGPHRVRAPPAFCMLATASASHTPRSRSGHLSASLPAGALVKSSSTSARSGAARRSRRPDLRPPSAGKQPPKSLSFLGVLFVSSVGISAEPRGRDHAPCRGSGSSDLTVVWIRFQDLFGGSRFN